MTRLTTEGPEEEDNVREITVLYGMGFLQSSNDRHESGSSSVDNWIEWPNTYNAVDQNRSSTMFYLFGSERLIHLLLLDATLSDPSMDPDIIMMVPRSLGQDWLDRLVESRSVLASFIVE
jgi:hypothetical protein